MIDTIFDEILEFSDKLNGKLSIVLRDLEL